MCRMFTVTIGNEKKYLLLEQRRGDLGNHVRLNALRRLVKNHKLDVFQKQRKSVPEIKLTTVSAISFTSAVFIASDTSCDASPIIGSICSAIALVRLSI